MSYGNYEGANKVIRVVNCFQQVTHNEPGWDTGYCMQVMLICVLCFVNFALLTFILIVDIRNKNLRSINL